MANGGLSLIRRDYLHDRPSLGLTMPATIILPEKAVFAARSNAIKANIDTITQRNNMAKLLVNNFRGWVESSSMSPLNLTLELDKDNNGLITGDEFSDLLGKMTGERPPEWVTELMFSFTGASPDIGIAIGEWLAMLAALGVDIPDELFEVKTPITGTIVLTSPAPSYVDQELELRFDFSEGIDEFTLVVTQHGNGEREKLTVTKDEMDGTTFDVLRFTPDHADDYTLELMHLGTRLASLVLNIEPHHVEPEPAPEPEEPKPVLTHDAPPSTASVKGEGGLLNLVNSLEQTKLHSEAIELTLASQPMTLQGVVTGRETTLLGPLGYRTSITLHVQGNGFAVEVMMKPQEAHPVAGTPVDLVVQPHDWSLARRRLIALEM